MKSQRRIAPYLFAVFFVCLLLIPGAFNIAVSKGNAAKQQIIFPVQSRVPTISVIDSTIKDESVYITFRNDSKKAIKAITIGTDSATNRTEYLNSPEVLPAEGTFAAQFDLPDKTTKVIYLFAVAYDDGMVEGAPQYVKQIQDARAGTFAQVERILPIFQNCLTEQCWRSEENWQRTQLKLQSLPESEEEKSFDYKAALINTKNHAILKAGQYDWVKESYDTNDAYERLTHLIKDYEGKLKAWSNAVNKQRVIEEK